MSTFSILIIYCLDTYPYYIVVIWSDMLNFQISNKMSTLNKKSLVQNQISPNLAISLLLFIAVLSKCLITNCIVNTNV